MNEKRHPQGTVYYLGLSDFLDGKKGINPLIEPSVMPTERVERHYLNSGDNLILAKGHHGFPAYTYNAEKSPAVASSVFLVLRELDPQVLPEYLAWFINLQDSQLELENMSRGSSMPSINRSLLGELDVLIPPLDLQSKIVKISNLKQRESELIEELDSLASKTLEHQLFKSIKQYD